MARARRAPFNRQGLEFKTASLLRAARLFRDSFCFFAAATSSHADDLKGATGRTMTRSSSPDRHEDRFDTDDVHHAREVVGEHVQRHLGRQFWAAYSSKSASPPYPSSARQTDPRRSRGQYALHPGACPGAPAQHQQRLLRRRHAPSGFFGLPQAERKPSPRFATGTGS